MAEIIDTSSSESGLGPGQSFESGNSGFSSPNGQYKVYFDQHEGDLKVLDESDTAIWSAMKDHSVPAISGGSVLMQEDGNLVGLSNDRSRADKPVWGTGTDKAADENGDDVPNANPGSVLSLQNNGILVIRRDGGRGRVIWASKLQDDWSPFAGPDQVKGGLWIRSTLNDE